MTEAPATFLIMKRGLYYRPDDNGYTGIKEEAGRYSLPETAVRFPMSDDSGRSFIHEGDAPEYSPACWEETKLAHQKKKLDGMRDIAQELVEALSEVVALSGNDPHGTDPTIAADVNRTARAAIQRAKEAGL